LLAIVFVYDYHPLSKTLAEAHFGPSPIFSGSRHVPENVLWSYIVQLASALKTIHNTGLAARVIDLSKVLLTSKMRYPQSAVTDEGLYSEVVNTEFVSTAAV
jgi:PAB-dependent poly(A)-specific ribonuclease subunit 3